MQLTSHDSPPRASFDLTLSHRLSGWRVKLLVALFALTIVAAAASTGVREAHGAGIAVQSSTAVSSFPNGIVFRVSASSDAKISQARLLFQVLPTGPVTEMNVDCNGGTLADCSKTVGGPTGIYIVPFTQVRYSWEIKDENGGSYTTTATTVTYDDPRFKWKSLSEGNLTVFYYDGDEKDIREILTAGRETIDRMSKLQGTVIDFPVKVLDYATARDLQPAVASSRFGGGNGITLGEVSSADTAIETRQVFGGGGDAMDTVRHELAHVVTNHATRANPNLDAWINEGISVWVETKVDGGFKSAIDRAIRNNTAVSLVALSTSLRSSNPNLFYGQSHSVVKYLIDTYGEPRFTSFIRALNAGLTNEALRKTYDLDGIEALEDAWRKSVGLPAYPPVAASSSDTASVMPTIVPFGSVGSTTSRPTGQPSTTPGANEDAAVTPDSGSDQSTQLMVVGGLLLVLVLGTGSIVVLRRTRRTPEPTSRE